MRRLVLILLTTFAITASAFAQADSSVLARLDTMLVGYVDALQRESLETKEKECDFLINSSNIPEIRQHIALKLFDCYKESKVMGDEAVAIDIYDKWFATGKIPFRGEFEQMQAELFANFNRSSLLGMDAPKVLLRKPCGGKVSIPEDGKPSILYFYDTSCGKCKVESQLLPGVLDKIGFKTNLYLVYAGQNKKEWRRFRREFKCANKNVRIMHLWDPEIESDYLKLYGVISTPKLFFIEPEGTIVGRRLEIDSLMEVIDIFSLYLTSYGKE